MPICKESDCDQPAKTGGWCRPHGNEELYPDMRRLPRVSSGKLKPQRSRLIAKPGERRCSGAKCPRKHYGRGWCAMHYRRWYVYGTIRNPRHDRRCSIFGCLRKHLAKGWCNRHYLRWYRHGDPLFDADAQSKRIKPKPLCLVVSCDRAARTRGICAAHSERLRIHGDVMADVPIRSWGTCLLVDCGRGAIPPGMCHFHQRRVRLGRDPLTRFMDRICLVCTTGFTPTGSQQKYCRLRCKNKARAEREHARS